MELVQNQFRRSPEDDREEAREELQKKSGKSSEEVLGKKGRD